MSQDGLFKQSFVQLLVWVCLYFIVSKFDIFPENMEDGLTIILTAIISYLISLITLFHKPIQINIIQKSQDHKENNMGIIVRNKKIAAIQSDRLVDIDVSITRKRSLWWLILLFLMKKQRIKIEFQLIKPALTLTPTVINSNCDNNTNFGFELYMNDFFILLSQSQQNYNVGETYSYYPQYTEQENESYLIPSAKYIVEPKLTIVPTSANIFTRFISSLLGYLIKFKSEIFTFNIKKR